MATKKKINKKCLGCKKRCKQTIDVKVIVCKSYEPVG